MRFLSVLAALLAVLAAGGVCAGSPDSVLRSFATLNDTKGWEAVGRLDLADRGFCTGAMIAPSLVLTAAHCLFEKDTGARIDAASIRFRAGWQNGRATAYRGVRRTVVHPDYSFTGRERVDRVLFDLALVELDQPIRLPSVHPFATGAAPRSGASVGVVSYAQNRAEAPSLQRACNVIADQPDVVILSCDVDFGSSGAPVFAFENGVARIVSVISAKAELDQQPVALGTLVQGQMARLTEALNDRTAPISLPQVGRPSGSGGAKFLRP